MQAPYHFAFVPGSGPFPGRDEYSQLKALVVQHLGCEDRLTSIIESDGVPTIVVSATLEITSVRRGIDAAVRAWNPQAVVVRRT